MAYTPIIAGSGVNPSAGPEYAGTTADSADWPSVPIETYFFDLRDKLVYYKDATGTVISPYESGGGSSSGVWGISDTAGTYTYYSDIASANAAAVVGDTIELFANVRETNPVQWSLKAGVRYNLNGHTYTLDVATTESTVVDSALTSTDEVHIFNGIIKRASGGSSSSHSFVLYSTSTGKIKLESVHLINEVGYCTRVNSAKLDGGIHEAQGFGTAIYINNFSAEVKNARALGSYQGIYVASGKVIDSYAYSENEKGIRAFAASAQVINCVAYSNANSAIEIQNNDGEAIGCTGYSTGGSGFSGDGIFVNCTAYSTSGNAMSVGNGARVKGCDIYGTSVGLQLSGVPTTDTLVQNCTIKADGSQAVVAYWGGTFLNCSVEGAPLTYGDCFLVGSGGTDVKIFGCSAKVRNASAECITGPAGTTTYYGNNIFAGNPTLAVSTNVTQGQTANHDNKGNIEVD